MLNQNLLEALDNNINYQLGENNNIEYTWSNNLQEAIIQFSYQITQNGSENKVLLDTLKNKYNSLILNALSLSSNNPNKKIYLTSIYKLIAQTRDIVAGKGLYTITYMMISEWAKIGLIDEKYKNFCLTLAENALENLVKISDMHPLGSWKDIKYFANYWLEELDIDKNSIDDKRNRLKNDRIFLKLKELITQQLNEDLTNNNKISLVAKWIPRETSKKFGWLTIELAEFYFDKYIKTAKNEFQKTRARNKCLKEYRIIITNLNKQLKTPQINQCQQNWKEINFDKNVSSITLRKQSLAFQNVNKKGNNREHSTYITSNDRIQCAENYKKYIRDCTEGKKIIKGKNVSIIDLVKGADELSINININNIERACLNAQWKEHSKTTENLGKMIAIVDTSGSMEADNCKCLYSAIGLGLRVAEKSIFGKRVLTFSNEPKWVNLDDCTDFVACIKKIREAPWGMNTNLQAALDMILKAAIENHIDPDILKETTLISNKSYLQT